MRAARATRQHRAAGPCPAPSSRQLRPVRRTPSRWTRQKPTPQPPERRFEVERTPGQARAAERAGAAPAGGGAADPRRRAGDVDGAECRTCGDTAVLPVRRRGELAGSGWAARPVWNCASSASPRGRERALAGRRGRKWVPRPDRQTVRERGCRATTNGPHVRRAQPRCDTPAAWSGVRIAAEKGALRRQRFGCFAVGLGRVWIACRCIKLAAATPCLNKQLVPKTSALNRPTLRRRRPRRPPTPARESSGAVRRPSGLMSLRRSTRRTREDRTVTRRGRSQPSHFVERWRPTLPELDA